MDGCLSSYGIMEFRELLDKASGLTDDGEYNELSPNYDIISIWAVPVLMDYESR